MNHRAKFDAASFILGGEILNRTNTQNYKQISTSVFWDGRISTHADPTCTRRANFIDTQSAESKNFCMNILAKVRRISTNAVTAAGIAETIVNVLKSASIDVRYSYGQGYDGAVTMSDHLDGVQATIRKERQLAIYMHCACSYCLNLACGNACSVPTIRNCHRNRHRISGIFQSFSQAHSHSRKCCG